MVKRLIRSVGFITLGVLFPVLLCLLLPSTGDAGLYTAVSRGIESRIMAKGLNPSKFRPGARFNRSAYLSRRPATAIAEKGKRSSVIRMQGSAYLKNRKNIWDLRNPTSTKLHGLLGKNHDLRGAVKNGVIGSKTGRMLGKKAGERGKAIEYRSVKNGWTNLAIPKKLFERLPGIVKPAGVLGSR